MKILLVEDHPIFRIGETQLVRKRWPDADIGEAETLAAALSMVRNSSWDVAVVDLNLPDANGIESISQIHRAAPTLRILGLSLHDEVSYASQAIRQGAMGYLAKGHSTAELMVAVERIAKGGRYISSSLADRMVEHLISNRQLEAHETLGAQEYRVMLQLAAGQRVSDIAQTMHLSVKTVSTYRARIFEKLGIGNLVELVHYCQSHALHADSA